MKFLVKLAINAIAVYLTAYILRGVHLDGFWGAFIVALVLAILNATIRPILIFSTIPATIVTLGLFLLVINAVVIMLADWLLDGFKVDGFLWALLFSIILSIINSILSGLILDKEQPNQQ